LTFEEQAALRRRDAQTEAILDRLSPPRDAAPTPSLRDVLFPRSAEVAVPTDAQRGAHEARVRDTQAGWGPVRRGMARAADFAGEHVPEFLSGALWGDPTAPDASRANLLGQMLMAGVPFAGGIKGSIGASRGLFSRLDDAIDLIPAKGAHPNKVASLLSRASREELEHRGVPAFLAAQGNTPVTREALRAHLQAHPAPFPEVTTLGLPRIDVRRGRLERMEVTPRLGEPKYSQYQVPGGTNYRETVLTLPGGWKEYNRVTDALRAKYGPGGFDNLPLTPTERTALNRAGEGAEEGATFTSSHFDELNVLVHTRANERTLPTGERGRFLEEVQSDWHQKGKAKGYATDNPTISDAKRFFGISDEKWGAMDDVARETYLDELTSTRFTGFVPDAPFKDAWPDLGFKQQLLEVADDPTLDWIGWTSGKTQADRYDLSQQIGQVTARPTPDGRIHLDALTPDMGTQVINQVVDPGDLDGIIGKEISDKIRSGVVYPTGPSDMGTPVELSGLDLQVGGKGMVEFYDRLLPKRVAKIVKPFGGTVEQVSMGAGQPDQWIVRLTPEMKAKIKQGLPLLALPAGVQVSASRPEED
tara:strand:+ start:404 stop:2167 length:1764 start_codon:yes stop_codon:yes gene_type:complete